MRFAKNERKIVLGLNTSLHINQQSPLVKGGQQRVGVVQSIMEMLPSLPISASLTVLLIGPNSSGKILINSFKCASSDSNARERKLVKISSLTLQLLDAPLLNTLLRSVKSLDYIEAISA